MKPHTNPADTAKTDTATKQAQTKQQEREKAAEKALRRTENMYIHMPVGRLFAKVATPGAASMLLSALYQLFEGLLVGNFLGQDAFAAVNFAMPFVIVNFAVADLIGVGSSVVISIALGKQDDERADRLFTLSVAMVIGLSAIIGLALFVFARPIMTAMGARGELLEDAIQFLQVYAVFSPITTLVDAVDNYLRICGAVTYSLVMNIVLTVLGVGLVSLFLAVFHWGVWAAALGFCLAIVVAVAMGMAPLVSGRMRLRFTRLVWDGPAFRAILKNGMPVFLDNVAGRIFSIALNSTLVRFGGAAAVSVYGIVQYVDGVIQPLMYGMVDATQPAIGYNWGARRRDRVRSIVRLDFIASACVCAVAATLVLSVPEWLAHVFIPTMPAAQLGMCVLALRLMAITYASRWIFYVTVSTFQALSRSREATILAVANAFVVPFLMLAVLWRLRLTGIWLNMPVTTVIMAVISAIMFTRERSMLHERDV